MPMMTTMPTMPMMPMMPMMTATTMTMHNTIANYIITHSMIRRGATLLVGVSGGPDSLCLLHVLERLREQLGIHVHIAHLDHMLRGDAGAADAAFVRGVAEAWGLPVTVEQSDVAALAARDRLNGHDAARRARYAFFARLAATIGASSVATAHTADDQAETVLMHLLRGAGTDGLAGMRPVSALPTLLDTSNRQLIRPLLATTRVEVEAYCAANGLEPRYDETNTAPIYTRNRIRHELLPLLLSYNSDIISSLGRTAVICADDAYLIQHMLAAAWPTLARAHEGGITFDGAVWRALEPALQRAALRRGYAALGGDATLGWEHVEQARMLNGVGKRLPLPGGVWLTVGYDGTLTLGQPAHDGPQLIADVFELPVPSEVALCDGWLLRTGEGTPPAPLDCWTVVLNQALLDGPLLIRGRQAGDRIRPTGGRGSRSLQNVFVDRRVPQVLRARWPVIADTQSIIWLAGLHVAAGYSAQPDSASTMWIQIVPPQRSM